jgi:uncharacterized membrane protein
VTAIETLDSLTLSLHIVAGFVALFGGAGAFLTKKGGLTHRRFGRAYVYSMAFVAGSALALFVYDATPTRQFLALVAVFSFYLSSRATVSSRGSDHLTPQLVSIGVQPSHSLPSASASSHSEDYDSWRVSPSVR